MATVMHQSAGDGRAGPRCGVRRNRSAAAVDALNRLTVINHIRVSAAVGDSLADLLADGTDDLACVALRSSRNPSITRSAARLCSSLSWSWRSRLDRKCPLMGAGGRQLAAAAGPDGPCGRGTSADRLACGSVFFLPGPAGSAEQVMTAWATAAESDPVLRQVFLRTSGRSRLAIRVRHLVLAGWPRNGPASESHAATSSQRRDPDGSKCREGFPCLVRCR